MNTKLFKLLFASFSLLFMIACANNHDKKDTSKEDEKKSQKLTANSTLNNTASYYNDKYDYSILYPTDFLTGQGENDSKDGQIFISEDKTVVLRVYARYNVLFQSIDELVSDELQGKQHIVQHDKNEDRSFIESQISEGYCELEYMRYLSSEDTFYFLTLHYPNARSEEMKRIFNQIRTSLDRSLDKDN